jgi:predicted ferric reductase
VQLAGPPEPGKLEAILWSTAVVVLVVVGSLLFGKLVGQRNATLLHNRMLPWILGRSLGVASYLALTAMVTTGLWLRHPWRQRLRTPGPEALLRAHVTLAAATVTLLAGHLTAIALDHYAGVGWTGAFVPWKATYRPTAVALGTVALYGFVLVAGTAALAGSLGRRLWFPIHTVSAVVFGLTLMHGVLAGSDLHALRWLYAVSGLVVVAVQITRWTARYVSSRTELDLS